jgi:methylated-DNA-[protein]-cysteine S-methyltransferase
MVSEFTHHLPIQTGDFELELKFNAQKLLSLCIYDKSSKKEQVMGADTRSNNDEIEAILLQLKNYFSTAISLQSIPLAAKGTPFQKSVWRELSKIPIGETRTYGEIAKKLNSSARAVGNACRRNPIQIIVPCHRVISAKGIGGYAGETQGKQLSIKRWLLNHEGVQL